MPRPDTNMLSSEVLVRIEEKIKRLHSMPPLPEDVAGNLHEEAVVLHTYHSNALERNTLTLTETGAILTEGERIEGKSPEEHREAVNTAKAFELTEILAKEHAPISHATIRSIHEVVAGGIADDAGAYRRKNIRVIAGAKQSPNWTEVTKLMTQLLRNVENSRLHPIETAAFFHYGFVEISPFSYGNGQMARLLTNLYLTGHAYPGILIKKEDRKNYNQCIKSAHSGDLAPFSDFITKAVDESLTISLSAYGGDDELMPLEEIAEMTPFSEEEISMWARQGVLDAVRVNKKWFTSITALERYFALHEDV